MGRVRFKLLKRRNKRTENKVSNGSMWANSQSFNQQTLLEYLLRPDNFTGRKACQLGSKGWQNNARAILQDLSSPGPKLTSCCSSPPFGFTVSVNDNTRHLTAQAGKLGDISDFSLPHGPHSVIDPSH